MRLNYIQYFLHPYANENSTNDLKENWPGRNCDFVFRSRKKKEDFGG